jgi:DNA (cytosine-5)-methyltransferase 1
LLDLFSGIGGTSVGYARAGFDVTGCDNQPHPDYPFPMVVEDAMTVLADRDYLSTFDVVAASPPCPLFSSVTKAHHRVNHADLLTPTLEALASWGGTYVVENVPRAPIPDAVVLCGSQFGLGAVCKDGRWRYLRRHRLFGASFHLTPPVLPCDHRGQAVGVYGNGAWGQAPKNDRRHSGEYQANATEARAAMGIDWSQVHRAVTRAIPPAYTQHVGAQLMRVVRPDLAALA